MWTYEEKRGYNDALLNYAKKDTDSKLNKSKRNAEEHDQNSVEIPPESNRMQECCSTVKPTKCHKSTEKRV